MYYTSEQIKTEKNPELEEYRRYLEQKVRALKLLLKPKYAWLVSLNGEGYLPWVQNQIERYTQRLDEVTEELERRCADGIPIAFILEACNTLKPFTIE